MAKGGASFIPLYIVMAMGFFLDGLDGTIVTVALPTIGESFGMDASSASWVITVYFLMMAGLILIFGKLSESGNLKKILVGGFGLFAVASLFCGLSTSFEVLLVFRAIQGIGSAMLAATAIMLPVKYLPPGKLGLGMALTLLGSAIGAAVAPTIGGILTETLSWHWVFFINVPIGSFMVLFALRYVPKDEKAERFRFDMVGSVLLFISLVSGLYVLEAIPSQGFDPVTGVLLAVFAVFFVAFISVERRRENPVLNLGLFRLWKFDLVTVAYILINLCFMGMMYLVPFYLTIMMGMGAFQSGMCMFIPAFVTMVLCMLVPRMVETRGNRPFALLGIAIAICVYAAYAVIDPSMPTALLFGLLIVTGMIWGVGSGAYGTRMVANVPYENRPAASSILSFVVYFGSALGTALYSGLFNMALPVSGIPISDLMPEDFIIGFRFVMIVGVVLMAAAFAMSHSVKGD